MREASASLCAHALLTNDTTVIPDARNDDRFHDNPLVTGPPGIRFYAGRPLAAPNGLTASIRDRANARRRTRPARQRRIRVLLSADGPADIGEPISRASRRRSRSTSRPTHAAMRSDSESVTSHTVLGGSVRSPALLDSADRQRYEDKRGKAAVRDCKRTARRYATTRATATAGVTATAAASRAQPAAASLSSHTAARSPSLPRFARASDRADGSRSTSDGRTDPPLAHSDRPRTCRRPAS